MCLVKNSSILYIAFTISLAIVVSSYSDAPLTTLDLSHIGSINDCQIVDGILYAAMYGDETNPDYGCGVLAYDLETLDELWFYRTSDTEEWSEESPWYLQVYGDSIYCVVNRIGLLRINRTSGIPLKTYETSETIISPFVVGDGVLYMSDKYNILAIDMDNGEVLWRYKDKKHESGMMPTIMDLFYDDGRLYVGNIQPTIRCFDGRSGDLIWNSSAPVGSYVTIYHISESFLYVINAGDTINTLAVLNKDTGEGVSYLEGCKYKAGNEDVLILFTFEEGSLLAVDPIDGETLWSIPEGDRDLYNSNDLLCGDVLCVGDEDGVLYGFDLKSGDELWGIKLSDSPLHLISEKDDSLYVISEWGDIYKLDVSSGEIVWDERVIDEIMTPIGLQQNFLYFSSDSKLYLLDTNEFVGDTMGDKKLEELITPCWVSTILATKSEEEAQEKVAEVGELLEYGDECGYLWIPDYASLSGADYYLVYLGPYKDPETSQYIAGHYLWMNPNTYCIKVSSENIRETLPPKYDFSGFFPSLDRLLINFQGQAYPELPIGWHKKDYSDLKYSSTINLITWDGDDRNNAPWHFSVYGSYQIGPYDVLVKQRFTSVDKAREVFKKYFEYATKTYGDPIRETTDPESAVWGDLRIYGFGAKEKGLEYFLTLDSDVLRFRVLVVEMDGEEVGWDEGN